MTQAQGSEELARIYGNRFFARRYKLNWRAPIVVGAFANVFDIPKKSKIIDLGCATGDLVAEWRKWGYEAHGIEGSIGAQPYLESRHVYFYDLSAPIEPQLTMDAVGMHMLNKFSLVTCLEVFEHIPPKNADTLVDNVCFFSDRIVISAAGPEQGGHNHVNCRVPMYWIKKFKERGFTTNMKKREQILDAWEPFKDKPGILAYYINLLVFEKEK